MKETFYTENSSGSEIFCVKWLPDKKPIAIFQIVTGMMEYIERYDEFASFLNKNRVLVIGHDHRGHGKTAKSIEELGIVKKEDTFEKMVEDIDVVKKIVQKEYPSLPFFLFGHSFGSFLVQRYIQVYNSNLDGVILSGTTGKMGLKAYAGLLLSSFLRLIYSGRHKSKWLNFITFAPYNWQFKPAKTKVDWLSSDETEVTRYVDDELCGKICCVEFFYNIFRLLTTIHKEKNLKSISPNLPIMIIAGSRDPVGQNLKTISWLVEKYVKLGINSIKVNIYKDFRHECLHERGKEIVFNDIKNWIFYIFQENFNSKT